MLELYYKTNKIKRRFYSQMFKPLKFVTLVSTFTILGLLLLRSLGLISLSTFTFGFALLGQFLFLSMVVSCLVFIGFGFLILQPFGSKK